MSRDYLWPILQVVGYDREIESPSFGKKRWPHPVVRAFHESEATYKVAFAPARTSKSFAAAHDVLPDLLSPIFTGEANRGIILGPDYDKASKEFMYIIEALVGNRRRFKDVLGAELPEPVTLHNSPAAGRLYVEWPWGASVICKSAKDPAAAFGDQWEWAILSETAQLDSRTWLRSLRTRVGRAIFPTTPSMTGLWLKQLVEESMQQGDERWAVFTFPPEANPYYDMNRFKSELRVKGSDDPYFREQFLGEWTFVGGRVFPRFQSSPVEDISVCVTPNGIEGGEGRICVEPFQIPSNWKRFGAIDFGWADPTCHLWFAVSPGEDVVVFDEYYKTQSASQEHLATIREQSQANGSDTRRWYAFREKHGQGRQIAEDWIRDHGFVTIPVECDRIQGRMQLDSYMAPNLRSKLPRLRIVKDRCPNLVRELLNLHYDRDSMHREGAVERWRGDDHAVDALRYGLQSRPRTSKPKLEDPDGLTLGMLRRHARKMRRIRSQIGYQRDSNGMLS